MSARPGMKVGAHPASEPVEFVEAPSRPRSVLVIGSGPVVIGQAAEFDYAGTQACRSLREEGVRVILVNSNPATIMTDAGSADAVYIEPLTVEVIERIIERERPEALLATLGGQTALNLAVALDEAGVLDRYGVRSLGTSLEAIKTAEDRERFKDLLGRIGEPAPESKTVVSLMEAREFVARIGLPVVVRPAFTLGGTGGGLCDTEEQLAGTVTSGLALSPIGQVLVERSLAGWRELEYEVMRDGAGTCITVCNMENIDPMGVHTGDSIVVAPSQTLTDREHQQLRSAALRIIRALEICGGCNVQFAMAPDSHEYYVIEVNPRVSRSSALASKATGYPIARVAAKIALGMRLDEITNSVTGKTTAAFEPALDYCVVKIPRWPFDKFPAADRRLGTQMKSTGEVMAIERTFEAAFNKALRSLEQPEAADVDLADPVLLQVPNDRRAPAILQAFRSGTTVDDVQTATGIGRWFLDGLARIVGIEGRLKAGPLDEGVLREAKQSGMSDRRIADLAATSATEVLNLREGFGITPSYKSVDTCAAEFAATTPYYYSTFEAENEQPSLVGEAIAVVGSGPIRIGQGIEFDYCSVQAATTLQDLGREAIMINSNPETVSTDFDCSTRLYFEPLDEESVAAVIESERALGALVQFGGQTAVNLADPLERRGVAVLGTDVGGIEAAEDRKSFEKLIRELGVAQAPGAAAQDEDEAARIAEEVGYPVLVRPSFVLGGRAMQIVQGPEILRGFVRNAMAALPPGRGSRRGTVLVDKYLLGVEVDVDVVADGETVVIPGLMEHIERAGVHSGDSMAAFPAQHLEISVRDAIVRDTILITRALGVRGLCNIQFVVWQGTNHVIEVNPRASRTVPFLTKVSGVPMVDLATRVMCGERLADLGWRTGLVEPPRLVAVKAPVFSTGKLVRVDSALGPEMKSTGEVMGIDVEFGAAVEKAFTAALGEIPLRPAVLCSIADEDKDEALPLVRRIIDLGFEIYATIGTATALSREGIASMVVERIGHGHPDVVDIIEEGRVSLVINTVSHLDGQAQPLDGDVTARARDILLEPTRSIPALPVPAEGLELAMRTLTDGYRIRAAAEQRRVPCCTSLDTASALVEAIARDRRGDGFHVMSMEEYRQSTAVTPA